MQKNLLSDSAFTMHTIFFALLIWALLQGTVSTVHAAQTAPQPIVYTATVGVGVENAIREDAVIITTDTKEE